MAPQTKRRLQAVPTHVITGFLGVGKTSAILSLLKNKPQSERWAVLVNEFGEIGVDGSIFQAEHPETKGVFIREVTGGCMCCAAGLPMQFALNELLLKARPDRLLIEPTGLGHPKEVLRTLSDDHYRDVLDLQKTITLVDARKLSDQRYTQHDTFNQQIAMADVVIGNKLDLYGDADQQRLRDYVKQVGQAHVEIDFAEHGVFDFNLLLGRTIAVPSADHAHHHAELAQLELAQPFPEAGFISAINQGEGFVSVGWRFEAAKRFSYSKVRQFVEATEAERLKAVFITDTNCVSFNKTVDGLQERVLDTCSESRVEIIAQQIDPNWQSALLACLAD